MTTGITAQSLIIKYFGAGHMPASMFVLASVDQNEGGVPGKPGQGYTKQNSGAGLSRCAMHVLRKIFGLDKSECLAYDVEHGPQHFITGLKNFEIGFVGSLGHH